MNDPALTPYPDWLRPPPTGYRAEDLDHLPDAPPHTELIDGSLVFTAPRTRWETRTTGLLHSALEAAPPDWEVWRSMTVVLDERNRPEPDLMVVDAHADWGPQTTFCHAADVLLVVEVVSEESQTRDRRTKPPKYAAAGIRYFWRVENVDGRPVAYTYESDPSTNSYVPTGIFHDRLKVEHPFPVEVELA
ncbi:Uma2 family endonuclease [Kitasatospora sp. NPDC088134]|uniref:Uma2 family endonuclease n=1 Tax=Kitasatospora sp. NPDC088134 TaxID=3364071 RepID=UPI003802E656